MKAIDIGRTVLCGCCGHVMLCDGYKHGQTRVRLSCNSLGCSERGKEYWLPLEVIELEPVDADQAPQ